MASRSANYTALQLELLLDALEACPQLVTGKLGGQIPTKHHQKLAWEAVAQKLNEIGIGCKKSGEQVRSKWHDMKYRVRQKAAKMYLQTTETGLYLQTSETDEVLTAADKRVLAVMGLKSSDPLTNTNFNSELVSLALSPRVNIPINIVDLNAKISENTDNADTLKSKAADDTSHSAKINGVTQENLNERLIEMDFVAENGEDCNAISVKVEDNTSNEASDYDWPGKVVIENIQSNYSEKNVSAEKDAELDTSNCNWPYAANIQKMDVALFIAKIKNYPEIWNLGSEEYRDRNKKEAAWAEISKEIIEGFEEIAENEKTEIIKKLTVRWKNIRDTYVKKVKSVKPGQPASYRRQYIYARQLSFLETTLEKSATQSSIDSPSSAMSPEHRGKIEENEGQNKISNILSSDDSIPYVPKKKGGKKRRKDIGSSIVDAPITVKPVDEDKAFFDSLLPTVKKLNEEQKLDFRTEVLQLLKRFRQGTVNRPQFVPANPVNVLIPPPVADPHEMYFPSQNTLAPSHNFPSQEFATTLSSVYPNRGSFASPSSQVSFPESCVPVMSPVALTANASSLVSSHDFESIKDTTES